MENVYHKSFGRYSYEIMDQGAYERFWLGKRPSSKEAFETWLFDPHKTQHQILKEHAKKNISYSNVSFNLAEMMKAGIIRRFQREDDDKFPEIGPKKRRTEMDIYAEILCLANEGGVRKSVFVFQANSNFKLITRYLSILLDRDLIEVEGKIYKTTDKGVAFLNHYEEIEKMGMRGPF